MFVPKDFEDDAEFGEGLSQELGEDLEAKCGEPEKVSHTLVSDKELEILKVKT